MAAPDFDDAHNLNLDLHLDTDLDRYQSFSVGSACPSLTSSLLSYGSSPTDGHAHRRSSGGQSDISVNSASQSTSTRTSLSPMIEYSSGLLDMVLTGVSSVDCSQTEMMMPNSFHCNDPVTPDLGFHWMGQEPKEPPADHSTLFSTPHRYLRHTHTDGFLAVDQGMTAGAALESSFSRPIFHDRHHSDGLLPEHVNHWRPSVVHSSPRTVAPSATFQPILPSSPACQITPSTPLQGRHGLSVTPRAVTSPYASSPVYAAPDTSMFDTTEDHITIQPRLVRTIRETKGRGSTRGRKYIKKEDSVRSGRLAKAGANRSAAGGSSGAGGDYAYVIEKNLFACTAEGCVDKDGKRKRFKRQEHLKRHQRTCHTGSRPHYCWVPECKTAPFSRTDNLNSHLLKTHGKNSPAARNRYIATLDPKSGVFDINYHGPFTKAGWPGVDSEDEV